MRVKIINDGGYEGLSDVEFPIDIVLECSVDSFKNYQIPYEEMLKIPGFFWAVGDAHEGESYTFFDDEVSVVQENGSSAHTKLVSDRKDLLIKLVQEYGEAINDGCSESEHGSFLKMAICLEEEKRLLSEIIKIIKEM